MARKKEHVKITPANYVKPSLRVTVTLKGFGQRPINGASILVDRTRLKQLFHTIQNRPSCCAFYWVTTFSSANRVSGWPRGRNLGGVTGELRRLGLNPREFMKRVPHKMEYHVGLVVSIRAGLFFIKTNSTLACNSENRYRPFLPWQGGH